MTNTLTISLELAERLDSPHSSVRNAALESLRRIIAAPVFERQEPVAVPVAYMRFDDDQRAIFTRSKRGNNSEPLYAHPTAYRHTSPPAPVAVVLPERREASYYADGNYSAADLAAIWNAAIMATASLNGCLNKVKEMNR